MSSERGEISLVINATDVRVRSVPSNSVETLTAEILEVEEGNSLPRMSTIVELEEGSNYEMPPAESGAPLVATPAPAAPAPVAAAPVAARQWRPHSAPPVQAPKAAAPEAAKATPAETNLLTWQPSTPSICGTTSASSGLTSRSSAPRRRSRVHACLAGGEWERNCRDE